MARIIARSSGFVVTPQVKWDGQSTTVPSVGAFDATFNDSNCVGIALSVDTATGNQLKLTCTSAGTTDNISGVLSSTPLASPDYRVRAVLKTGTFANGSNRFGILARASVSGGNVSGYFLKSNDFTGNQASLEFGYIVAGATTPVKNGILLATYCPGIVSNDYIMLDLEVQGGWISGYLNDKFIARFYDTQFTAAGAGGLFIDPYQALTMPAPLIPYFDIVSYVGPFSRP